MKRCEPIKSPEEVSTEKLLKAFHGVLNKAEKLNFTALKVLEVVQKEPMVNNKEDDPVNHPAHYAHPSGIECIEVTRHMNFNIGNAIKYLWRHGKKNPEATIEDLQKAIFYIQDEIKLLSIPKKLFGVKW